VLPEVDLVMATTSDGVVVLVVLLLVLVVEADVVESHALFALFLLLELLVGLSPRPCFWCRAARRRFRLSLALAVKDDMLGYCVTQQSVCSHYELRVS